MSVPYDEHTLHLRFWWSLIFIPLPQLLMPEETSWTPTTNTPSIQWIHLFLTNKQSSWPTSNVAMYLAPKPLMILDQCDPPVGMQEVNLPSPTPWSSPWAHEQLHSVFTIAASDKTTSIQVTHHVKDPTNIVTSWSFCPQIGSTAIYVSSVLIVSNTLNLSYAYNWSVLALFSL
jgi:hypothetical protein